jgi:uncharacterized phage-associated protein
MVFRLDINKAIEAAATLIRLDPGKSMGRKRLLALLYMADRLAFERSARPIIGGRLVAMKYGPIHSEVYDLIKGGHHDQARWSRHFQNRGHVVVLADEPDIGGLCRFETDILAELSDRWAGADDWDVAEATHAFPEYVAAYMEGTSNQISLDALIQATGHVADRERILEDAAEKNYVDALFATR